jgi:hypothetical protein
MFFILNGFTELFFRSEVLLITFRQANPLSTARGYGVDPATRILCSLGRNHFFFSWFEAVTNGRRWPPAGSSLDWAEMCVCGSLSLPPSECCRIAARGGRIIMMGLGRGQRPAGPAGPAAAAARGFASDRGRRRKAAHRPSLSAVTPPSDSDRVWRVRLGPSPSQSVGRAQDWEAGPPPRRRPARAHGPSPLARAAAAQPWHRPAWQCHCTCHDDGTPSQ